MKTFISVLALAAIAAADNHEAAAAETATEETAWKKNKACEAFKDTLVLEFAKAIQAENLVPVETDISEAGEVAWTEAQKDDYAAQKLALVTLPNDANGDSQGVVGDMTTADMLGALNSDAYDFLTNQQSGIQWKNKTSEATTVKDWIVANSTDFVPTAVQGQDAPTGTYDELCNKPVVDDDVEITVELKNWGLTHEKAAWDGARELKTTKTDEDGNATDDEYGTIEGRSGWKVTGGGSDSTNTMQFAWELNMKENGNEFKKLAMMWADSDDATMAEFSSFDFKTFDKAKGQLFLQYNWAQKAPKTVAPPVVEDDDDADIRRFLNDDEVVLGGAEGADQENVEEAAEEAKPKIDFEASFFDQTWTDGFTMQWTTKTEGAAYVPQAVTTRAPSSVWQIDQRLSKFVAGFGDEDTFENMTVRINMMQQQGDNAALTNVKEGGSAHLWIALVKDGADKFAYSEKEPVAVEWAAVEKLDDDEVDIDGEDSGEDSDESGEVTKEGDGEESKDGATSVTAFGVAIMAAISALAF